MYTLIASVLVIVALMLLAGERAAERKPLGYISLALCVGALFVAAIWIR